MPIKGEFYLKENCPFITLNGTESWIDYNKDSANTKLFYSRALENIMVKASSEDDVVRIYVDNIKTKSYKTFNAVEDYESICANGAFVASVVLRINKNKVSDNISLKTYLASNPITLYYQTTTPTYRLLTESEKAEYQAKKPYLDKMLVLQSFKAGNVIVNTDVAPSLLKATLPCNAQGVIAAQQTEIYSLEAENSNLRSVNNQQDQQALDVDFRVAMLELGL